ncbi:MAG TPA: 8-amino-7-oxononanoate synthase [Tepidisphaeraceae bacterium]
MGESLDKLCEDALGEREERGLLRSRRIVRPIDATHLECEGKIYVNFASNDYLGLTHHAKMIGAVKESAEKFGVGSGAAALISGYTEEHAKAEGEIARWKKMQSAMLMPSGYQANLAAVQTLAAVGDWGIGMGKWAAEAAPTNVETQNDDDSQKSRAVLGPKFRAEDSPALSRKHAVRFLIDQLAHSSLIDAVRGSGAEWRVFPHNHLGKLERLLRDAPAGQMQVVVTESIFSMDGDTADLKGISDLKSQIPFVLLLDEAHGSGVYGEGGSGYAAEAGCTECVDVSVVTLSKAMGGVGGAICGSKAFVDAVVNFGRAGIFSTNVPAMVASAARAAIRVMREEPARQNRLRELAKRVRTELGIAGPIDSPIIPVILGGEDIALASAERLKESGMWVVAVRPPTVKQGTSRLRITVSSEHTGTEINRLIAELRLTTDGHR